MKKSNSYSSRYQQDLISEYLSKGAIILDVRTYSERERGYISGSKHIEMRDIPFHAEILKKLNKPIIVVCAGGVRSKEVAKHLEFIGVDIINGGPWQNVENLMVA
ncbi:MAG: rhodanese-like domain-containing protein [Bacteroidota bacterium]